MSTTETALTVYLVMEACEPHFLSEVERALHHRFEIEHVTLQVEAPRAPEPCDQGASRDQFFAPASARRFSAAAESCFCVRFGTISFKYVVTRRTRSTVVFSASGSM